MGGDFGPRATLRGTASALLRDSQLSAILVGPQHLLDAELDSLPASLSRVRDRLQTLAVDGIVASDARPSRVLRSREPSSMSQALGLVANGQAAQVSYHLKRAMDNGLAETQASEALTQLAFYAGWPNVFSAMPVFKDVFAQGKE